MKNLILLICIASLFASCKRNDWHEDYVPRMWYIGNRTDQTLIFKHPYPGVGEGISFYPILAEKIRYRETRISPYERVAICRGMIPKESEPWVNFYFSQSAEALGEDVIWQIISEDGEVLKTWNYSDRYLPDQRFFNEKEWYETRSGLWPAFGFGITPEDISTE